MTTNSPDLVAIADGPLENVQDANFFLLFEEHAASCVAWVLDCYKHYHTSWDPENSKLPIIVDVGCESGQLCNELAKHCERLIAVNVPPSHLEFDSEKLLPNVEYREGWTEELSKHCPPGQADLIVVSLGVQVRKIDSFYTEVKKCLRPGGTLALIAYWYTGVCDDNPKYWEFLTEVLQEAVADKDYEPDGRSLNSCYLNSPYILPVARDFRKTKIFSMTLEEIRDGFKQISRAFEDGANTVYDIMNTLPEMPNQECIGLIMDLVGKVMCN